MQNEVCHTADDLIIFDYVVHDIFLPNVKEHATLSAGASVDHWIKV